MHLQVRGRSARIQPLQTEIGWDSDNLELTGLHGYSSEVG